MKLAATEAEAGLRLDVWLCRRLPELSRSRLQELLRGGHILVGGRPAKPHSRVRTGQEASVHVPAPAESGLEPEPIPLDVLYEDDDVVVVNKPPGLVVHPAAGHRGGTLVNALLHHCPGLAGVGGELRPGIVHRLDKDTSGALVVAKNDAAMQSLGRQFRRREIEKQYLALVRGVPRPARGAIETLIGRSAHNRQKMSARPRSGREAVTRYEVEEVAGPGSLVRLWLETGRTHQIRVHLAHIGHPVAGDKTYGRPCRAAPAAAPRQMLHAQVLGFAHPRRGLPVRCQAPVPPDMRRVIEQWRT